MIANNSIMAVVEIWIPTIRNGSRYFSASIGYTYVKSRERFMRIFQEAIKVNFEIFHTKQNECDCGAK